MASVTQVERIRLPLPCPMPQMAAWMMAQAAKMKLAGFRPVALIMEFEKPLGGQRANTAR